ncbi:glycosyltransferase family 4 protein [Olsenella uli]|uniref:glycosyltransferase family 4 protein n=1 Tax=Olsenella uli TaxID=133926 RepID=UPI00044F2457|nr:MraY family glycosyltransferase [Olsenella uli]EUB30557.1 putative undecaprenyl-phosphate N-acetylglucosaminyl 1-phosphate transferase [Olsenella uli MSTE5]
MFRPWMPYLCLFVTALLVALVATPLAGRIAWKVGAVDYPNKRRINRRPIPRMGGIAVFLGIIAAFVIQYLGTTRLDWPVVLTPAPHFASMSYQMLVVGFCVIFLTGVLDDIFQLKPLQKLLGQVIAAAVAVAGGLVIGTIVNPLTGDALELSWVAYPITVIYLVSYVNIFNLIDGLDGLASGIACIAGVTMFTLSVMAGRMDAASLAIALAGSTLGFLRYNFNPASIFLGDSGSLLLGYALGAVSLLSVTRVAGLTTIIVPLVIAGIPIIDTFSAIVRRRRAHVSIGSADRGHIHHRLIDEGFDQLQAVLLMYAWTAALCLGTFVMTQVGVIPRIAIFCLLLALSGGLAARLHLFRPVLLHHRNSQTGDDELVCPQDAAFDQEERKFERTHHPNG